MCPNFFPYNLSNKGWCNSILFCYILIIYFRVVVHLDLLCNSYDVIRGKKLGLNTGAVGGVSTGLVDFDPNSKSNTSLP